MKTFCLKLLFLFLCFSPKLSAERIQQTININVLKETRVLIKESSKQTETVVVVKFKNHKSKLFSAKEEVLNISERQDLNSIIFASEDFIFLYENVKEITILIPEIPEETILKLNLSGSSLVEISPITPQNYRLDLDKEARLLVSDEVSWSNLLKTVSKKQMKERIILKTKKSSNPEDRFQYRTPVDAMFLDAFSYFLSQ